MTKREEAEIFEAGREYERKRWIILIQELIERFGYSAKIKKENKRGNA